MGTASVEPQPTRRPVTLALLVVLGVVTFVAAMLSLIGVIPGYRDYYLFEWLIFPTNVIGYAIASGLAAVCLLLRRQLRWWQMAFYGAGAGATASVLAGLFYFLAHHKNLTSISIAFLATAGALPGLVIPPIYSAWFADRHRRALHFLGGALIAGTIITAMASTVLVLSGIWRWSPDLFVLIARQLWLVPTVFSVTVMISLYAAECVLKSSAPPPFGGCEQG